MRVLKVEPLRGSNWRAVGRWGGVCFGSINSYLKVASKSPRCSFSVPSTGKTFAPFLCDHCNVNEIARQ